MSTDTGTRVIEEIIKQGMFVVSHPDPDEAHVFVWSSGAAEQLQALIAESVEVQVARKEAALYGRALKILGAPDNGDPVELLLWAGALSARISK